MDLSKGLFWDVDLSFFDDADLEPDPLLLEKVSWEDVKKEIVVQIEENVG